MPTEAVVEEVMTVADAARNCDVKAKKTIVRWAEAEGLKEVYARTASSTIERAVPVEWVRQKMRERGIESEPAFERVEVAANVSFEAPGGNGNGNGDAEGVMLPDRIRALPEVAEIFEKFARVYEEHSELVENFIKESKGLTELVAKTMDHEHRKHESTLLGVVKNQKAQYALIGGILLLVLVGIGWGVHGLFSVKDDLQAELQSQIHKVQQAASDRADAQRKAFEGQLVAYRQSMDKVTADLKDAQARAKEASDRLLRVREDDLKQAREDARRLEEAKRALEDKLRALEAAAPASPVSAVPK